ncbi:hypothetical protein IT575_01105 [bacterium]|nr:hypothetical protein [bacterium]
MSPVQRTTIETVTLSSKAVHTGDLILVDCEFGSGMFSQDPRYGHDDSTHDPHFGSSAGELLPIPASIYTPGGPLPTVDEVRQALAEIDPQTMAARSYSAWQGRHAYFYLLAPEATGIITLRFFAGSPDGFWPSESVRELQIEVLP